jgi:archaeosine synthase
MNFLVKKRDGPARTGEIEIKNKKIIMPNIFFLKTSRFKAPGFADILLTNDNLKADKPLLRFSKNVFLEKPIVTDKYHYEIKDKNLVTVLYANQLFEQPNKFVDTIVKIREKIGYKKMIFLPSIGEPSNLALFTYMGIDFFDSTYAIQAARNNILLFPNRNYKKEKLKEIPCNCPSCNKFKGKPSTMDFQSILNHNYYALLNELKHVRNAINRGDLRNLVESRVKASPNLTSILRNLDMTQYIFLEKRTPITSKQQVIATSSETLLRPEIKRFQKRVIERYKKPEPAKVLLLLPCSAKKPYSFSKSHRFFRDRLFSSDNPFVVHELIITSPLGLVPRDIELVYPASSYDIPVTGIWYEDEKKMIRELLSKYLKNNKYEIIIAHLPEEIIAFTKDLLDNVSITCVEKPTSKESLDKLSATLKEKVKGYEKVKKQIRSIEDLKGLALYQFGKKSSEILLKNCTIKGKYPYQKMMYNNAQLGMVVEERGLISLTINGAERIAKSGEYWVEIYDDFALKGSVFAPGVKNADENVRIGDEVVVLKNKKLCGVGVAQMNSEEMKQLDHGEAVKVRHLV